MESQSWYEIVAGDSLMQGDLFFACPARWDHEWPVVGKELLVQWVMTDLIVLTQS